MRVHARVLLPARPQFHVEALPLLIAGLGFTCFSKQKHGTRYRSPAYCRVVAFGGSAGGGRGELRIEM